MHETGVFMTCASGSLVCISSSMVSMVQIADRELLKNPGVIAVFYGQFLRFFKTYRLFYFHDFPNRIGYFDVIVQSSELSGLAANGVEWNESTRV